MVHCEDAVENTLKVAEMCEEVVPTRALSLPQFKTPVDSAPI
jgi:DNA polymerase III alpha subunit